MKFINTVVDTELAKVKLRKSNVVIDDDIVQKVEKSIVLFRNGANRDKITTALKNLEATYRSNKTTGALFSVVKDLKKIFIETQYLNYIQTTFSTLNIFSNDFNWTEFTNKVANLIAVSSISTDFNYSLKFEYFNPSNSGTSIVDLHGSKNAIKHQAACIFEQTFMNWMNLPRCVVGLTSELDNHPPDNALHEVKYNTNFEFFRSLDKTIPENAFLRAFFGTPA